MKNNFIAKTSVLTISIIIITVMAFTACTRKTNTEHLIRSEETYERIESAGTPPQITSAQGDNQNNRLYGTWVNENTTTSNTLMFLEPNIFYEEGGTAIAGGRNSFLYNFDGRTLTISQGNDHSHTQVTINGDILTMGPFDGDHDWHYNLFLWGTFIKKSELISDTGLFLWDGKITVQIANNEILNKYHFFEEFSDHNASQRQKIVFTTTTAVRDFRYISIRLVDDEQGRMNIHEDGTEYLIDEFLPGRPFVVNWMEAGSMPHRAISYIDENNTLKYFVIVANNAEPEEEMRGPVLLIEYPLP